jgi:hypothetical protein
VITHTIQQTIARPKKKRILSHNLDNIKQLRCASISEGFFKPPPLPELIDDSCFKDGLPEPLIPGNAHQDFCSSFLGLKPTAKQATKIKQIRRLKLSLGHAQSMRLKKRSVSKVSEGGRYSNGTNSVGKCGSTRTGALVAVLNSRSLPALWT